MNKVYVCEIDQKVNAGKMVSLTSALRKVEEYIQKTIDPTFPILEFRQWVNSDSEKPFKYNRNRYFWDR